MTLAKTNGKNWKGTRKQKKSGESRKNTTAKQRNGKQKVIKKNDLNRIKKKRNHDNGIRCSHARTDETYVYVCFVGYRRVVVSADECFHFSISSDVLRSMRTDVSRERARV